MSDMRCPQCSAPFRESLKDGILIDVCTQCRGVWLDRGELEKLLTRARAADADDYEDRLQSYRDERPQASRDHGYREPERRPEYRRDDRYDRDDHHYRKSHKKSKFSDIFDIFD